jgi:hypothetical protein
MRIPISKLLEQYDDRIVFNQEQIYNFLNGENLEAIQNEEQKNSKLVRALKAFRLI